MPIKIGLAGSIQLNADAAPDTPEISANTGVMQQSEAAIADIAPTPINPLLFLLILFLFLNGYVGI